jgi:ubiquinone/menaquinone biosynthesis C-methylase UbiE
MNTFKDHFSKQATIYVQYRPTYPKELFDYLASLTKNHSLAWDCGTGNGQSALQLVEYFEKVYATDPSEQQIKNAIQDPKITYKVESAEQTDLEDQSVDLITVAQAVHWFDFDQFYAEVKRVLKMDGVIAVWAYGVPSISPEIDPIIRNFHDHVVGEFWQKENKLIDNEYETVPFPFQISSTPSFQIQKQWTMNELLGHFRTWSATQKFIDKFERDPIEELRIELAKLWGKESEVKDINWKLILKVGKVV